MDYARKNGVTEPLGAYMPGSYESERVTYGNTNVKDELDTINSNLYYKEIYTSLHNGTKTYGQAMSEMTSAYLALTDSQKLSAVIVASGEAYQNNYLPNGLFYRNGSDGVYFMNIVSGTYSRRLYTDITNLVDKSSVVLPFDITLMAR